MVVPVMNSSPGLWVETNEATLQLSDGVGAVHVTATEHAPSLSVMVILAGQPEMLGFSVSLRVITCSHVTVSHVSSSW